MPEFVRPRPVFPKRAVVTGGMPYGNKHLHFGHVAMMLRADTLARFLRDRIGSENVVFVSGTDCYGSTITETYRKLKQEGKLEGKSVEDFVYDNYLDQKQTFEDFEIQHLLKKMEIGCTLSKFLQAFPMWTGKLSFNMCLAT